MSVVTEDFESYLTDGQTQITIADHGPWKSSPYGKPGGLVVVKSDHPQNNTAVLTAPKGGDHHARLLFDDKAWQQAKARKAWALDVKVRGGMQVMLGFNPAYNPKPALQLKVGKTVQLVKADGKSVQSINTLDQADWLIVRLMLSQDQDNANTLRAWVAVKKLGDDEATFELDPGLRDIAIDISSVPLAKWNGLKFRLDNSRQQVDQINFQALDDVQTLLDACVKTQARLPFSPLLHHVASPRQIVDLGGIWQLTFGKDTSAVFPQSVDETQMVLVPGEHASLINSVARAGQRAWFFRDIDIPADWSSKRVVIYCERVTDQCDILVNGQPVGHSDEGILPFAMDITDAIKPGEQNRIAIGVLSSRVAGVDGTHQPVGWTWFYQQFNGIPLPVHLEAHDNVFISDVVVQTTLDDQPRLRTQLTINNTSNQTRQVTITAKTRDGQFQHASQTHSLEPNSQKQITLWDAWDNPRLWWPHDPHLYHLQISITQNTQTLDSYVQRLGFREIRVVGSQMLFNNVPYMHRRNSIIPYLSTMQEQTFASMVKTLRSFGYVGSRLHGGPSLRLVSMADEMGWLISPESAINEPRGHDVADDFWPRARRHAMGMTRLLRNHPSVAYWVLCNEFGSNYMPQNNRKGAWVDRWLNELGKDVMQLDPTRTVTFDGENDLGGRGNAGPAPTLNFHYAWQPFKINNMIPTTRNWLLEGGLPWQAIAWDRSKPIMLGEDMYDPYCMRSPYGSSQWGGNRAYDPATEAQVTYDAYHMLAQGYYRAGVAVWNPWGLSETRPKGAKYIPLGQVMPDYLIATDEVNRTFASAQTVERTLRVYNQLFQNQSVRLESQLLVDGKAITNKTAHFQLPAGKSHVMTMSLPMPTVQKVTPAQWQLRLVTDDNAVLCDRMYDYTLFPTPEPVINASDWAIVGPLPISSLDSQRFDSLEQALKAMPKRLLLAGIALSKQQGQMLDQAVAEGLDVTWIAAPARSWLPASLKLDDEHQACFAFISRPDDVLMQGLTDNATGLWGEDTLVASHTMAKPERGAFEIILSTGSPSGLTRVAMLRLMRGKGTYVICQMPLLAKAASEPAANELLHRLINMPSPVDTATGRLAVAATTNASLSQALTNLHIPFTEFAPGDQPRMLMVDASQQTINPQVLQQVKQQLAQGRHVWLQRPTQAWCDALAMDTQIKPQASAMVSLRQNQTLLAGLDNDDFYWQRHGKDSLPIVEQIFAGSDASASLFPASLWVNESANGAKLIACQLRWDQMAIAMPQRCGRIVSTMLHNAGVAMGYQSNRKTNWQTLNLAAAVNRGYQNVFGGGPDLTYFPVNRTGVDPVLHVPQPMETFTPTIESEGVPFTLTDPQQHDGKAAMVVGQDADPAVQITIPAVATQSIWLLGAVRDKTPTGMMAGKLQLTYSNGQTAELPIVCGQHVGTLTHAIPLSQGRIAWSRRARFEAPRPVTVYQYAWNMINPHPQWTVTSMRLLGSAPQSTLCVVAITLEP
ncbi:MAG: glycoside hydrolase family 2 protein [Phycisphaeraceae bacterium JB051]